MMTACASLACAGLAQVQIPAANNISTIAGNGSISIVNGVPATSSGMYPTGVAVDSMGNIYIADQNLAVIQEVTAATRIITTVAGNGTSGCTGDGGPATSAQLYQPLQVAVDGAGNIYIADDFCHSIRKVTKSTGVITTVAGTGTYGCSGDGGPATSAQIDGDGVAVDGSGNIYVVGYGCEVVRKVDASTGIISTVAGNGAYGSSGDGGPATSASLGGAIAVAIDGKGNLYIATYADNRVRKVTAATGIITTVAGNGTAGFSGDGGPATSAELHEPEGIAVDPVGDILIADNLNNRIRLVTASTGVISTLAGNGTAGFSGDGGPATSAELNSPAGVALDLSGNVYIADQFNDRIRVVGGAAAAVWSASPSDFRFQGVGAGICTVSAFNINMGVGNAWSAPWGSPLELGNGICVTPPPAGSPPWRCSWFINIHQYPPALRRPTTATYVSGILTDLNSFPNLNVGPYNLSGNNLVIRSLDVQPANDAFAIAYVSSPSATGFEASLQHMPVSDLQAFATSEGLKSRVITALSLDSATTCYVFSYGWANDPSSVYEATVASVTLDTVASVARSMASEGYVLTAFGAGGDPTFGWFLVGTRLKGSTTPRPIFVSLYEPSDDLYYLNGYVDVVTIYDNPAPGISTRIWIVEK